MRASWHGFATLPPERAAKDGALEELAIEAQGVCKEYNSGAIRVPALQSVTLRVHCGEVVAIMGPSGCGKTTLLNCLSGLDHVTAGTIRIGGRDLHRLSDRALTRFRAREMGFIFQTYNLLPVLTAVENVELPLLLSGARATRARALALEGLASVGLDAQARRYPADLSGGQQQRVAIARALATQPTLVWADEPTGALDSDTSQQIIELMLRLNRERHLTFVWVTHAREVAQQARRLILMRDGAVVEDRHLPLRHPAPGAPDSLLT
jgi:putative ABC transport system ATP-binding protein